MFCKSRGKLNHFTVPVLHFLFHHLYIHMYVTYRPVAIAGWNSSDFIDHPEASFHFPENCIFCIQERGSANGSIDFAFSRGKSDPGLHFDAADFQVR